MSTSLVIGLDGGGTYTRVVIADLSGRILSHVQTDGSSPEHYPREVAQANAHRAIEGAVVQAGEPIREVVRVVAGFAGIDGSDDLEWAATFTAVPGLDCPQHQVNDAVIAHAGALRGAPGIIVISGTGSIFFGINEAGTTIRNYDFYHYAPTAAPHLAFEAVYHLIAGDARSEDTVFVADLLAFWGLSDVATLARWGAKGFPLEEFEQTHRFGQMAPLVTEHALRGAPLAVAVCDKAVEALRVGIGMLGSCFTGETIAVALLGGVAQSAYIKQAVPRVLPSRYRVCEPEFPAILGAILMALEHQGIPCDEEVVKMLRSSYVPAAPI